MLVDYICELIASDTTHVDSTTQKSNSMQLQGKAQMHMIMASRFYQDSIAIIQMKVKASRFLYGFRTQQP